MPNTYRHTSQVRSKLVFSLDIKQVAAKCTAAWHDHDGPEASTECSNIRNRNITPPRSFNHQTDTVIQRSYVTPRVYHEVDLSSAKSKLPDFSGSPSEDEPPEDEDIEKTEAEPEILLQPNIRLISHEQLVSEVKGIYAGLVMVNAKCIDINERQSPTAQEKGTPKSIHLKNDQWQSLIPLHKQLLHEHHDFFLASQHPSASPALSRLAAKYAMPARMWRHGIYTFLEVLRHSIPESLEHMLAFIHIAYHMMALL